MRRQQDSRFAGRSSAGAAGAEARLAQKRGGDRQQLDVTALDPAAPSSLAVEESDFVIDLKNTLDRLDGFAPNESRAFRIYYFLG